MRRAVLGSLLAAVLVLLTACGVTPPSSPDDSAGLAAIKAAGHIPDCVTGQTKSGGLPAYSLPCLGGGTPVQLATLKGPLLINFWQAQCPPCREEMPALEQFHDKYGARLPILGIDSMDAIPRIALQTAVKRGITFPLAADPGGALQHTALAVHGLPTTFLLTAGGKVKFVSAGGMKSEADVEQKVSAALGAPLGAAL